MNRCRDRACRGLSPRVRGNPQVMRRHGRRFRSIPACTGEPAPRRPRRNHRRVYPRVYGGTRMSSAVRCFPSGLSPRVRGNHAHARAGLPHLRSIPACTGEPRPVPPSTTTRWVYPRVHGEPTGERLGKVPLPVYPRVYGGTHPNLNARRVEEGLSPRVRGNLMEAIWKTGASGSIPACTGEPILRGTLWHAFQVYPRVYGGTDVHVCVSVGASGLSPRVRGNHTETTGLRDAEGSIPACTGEPPINHATRRLGAVYPRVYGGTAF